MIQEISRKEKLYKSILLNEIFALERFIIELCENDYDKFLLLTKGEMSILQKLNALKNEAIVINNEILKFSESVNGSTALMESFMLRCNKNVDILSNSIDFIKKNDNFLEKLFNNGVVGQVDSGKKLNTELTMNFSDPDCKMSNSYLDSVLLIFLAELSLILQKPVCNVILEDLSSDKFGENGIIQPDFSPFVQGCEIKHRKTKSELYIDSEYLHFGKGYGFGGTEDIKYKDKLYKFEDCSSSVSKWIGLKNVASTYHFEWFADRRYSNFKPNEEFILSELVEKIEHKQSLNDIELNDILVWRDLDYNGISISGHTGIVSKIENIIGCEYPVVEILNCARNVPFYEGLIGKMIVDLNKIQSDKKYMIFRTT